MGFKIIGFVVVAMATVGLIKGVSAFATGDDRIENIPRHVNNEFNEIGLVVPGDTRPRPYRDVPNSGARLSVDDLHRLQDEARR